MSKRFKVDSPSVDISDIDEECSSANVNGVVVKLSPIKVSQSSGSRYFEGNLSDGKVSRRFVSLETRHSLRSAFEKNLDDGNCIPLKNCQVKRSTFSKREGNLEIIVGSFCLEMSYYCQKEFTKIMHVVTIIWVRYRVYVPRTQSSRLGERLQ